MHTFLLVLTVFSATLILPCRVEIEENVEKGLENNAKNTPSEEIQIDIANRVSLCARSPCDTVQVINTNSSLNGPSGILMDEVAKNTPIEKIQIDMPNPVSLCARSPRDTVQKVVSNNNSTTTDQTEIDTGETAVLLRQTPNESRDSAANNFLTGLTGESREEGRETTSSTLIHFTEVTSQPPVVAPSQEAGDTMAKPDLKTEYKVACWVIPISTAGIIGLIAGLPGNEKADLTHKTFFKAYTSLTYASFISGLGLFLLTKRRRTSLGLVAIVKVTMWVTLGSITYAISFATCILLHMTLIAVIPVLVVPLVFVGLVIFVIYAMK